MTLFDMIKDWRKVSIEKMPDDDVIPFHRDVVTRMRERIGEEATILSFSGANGGLFGAGYIIGLNSNGVIIDLEQTFIS